jgi:hypothetical protein
MSDTDSKVKHSKRIREKFNKLKHKMRIAKEYGLDHILQRPHKYHKTSMFNCGNGNCHMCGNPRKIWKEKTMQEKRLELRENDD